MADKTTRPPKDNLVRAVFPGVEFRDQPKDGTIGTITGYGAVWNTWTEISSSWEGHFLERINPSAFKKYLREQGVPKLLFQHGKDPQIGDKPLGPLTSVEPDSYGLRYEGDLLDTSYNRDLYPGLKAGLYGSSFRFSVVKEEFDPKPKRSAHNPDGLPERTILEATIPEMGPVTFPAYLGATAGARSGVRSMTDDFILEEALDQFIQEPEKLRDLIERRAIHQPERAALPADGAEAEPHSDEGSRTEPERAQPDDPEPERAESSDPPPVEAATLNPDPAPSVGSLSVREKDTVKTIEEVRSRLDEIKARFTELDAEIGVNRKSEEQETEWSGLLEERTNLEAIVSDYESRKAVVEAVQRDKPQNQERINVPQVINRGSTQSRVPANIYEIHEYRNLSRTPEEQLQAFKDGARRAVEIASFPHERADESANKARIEKLIQSSEGDRLSKLILATGSPVYQRAFSKLLAGHMPNAEEQRAIATVGSSQLADGGYAVPFILDPTLILTSNGQVNPLRQMARVETLTGAGNTWKGVTTAGITVSRVAEESAVTPTSPTLAQPSVTVQAVKAEIRYSIEADEDWPRLQAEMARLLQDAKDAEEAEQFINGNGDGTTGNPQGIVAGLDASSDVGTTGDGFDVEDVHRLINALPDRFEPRAQFLAHRAVYSAIAQFGNVANAGAGAVWQTMGQGRPPELLGYPARYSSAMESDYTTEGNDIMLFGDFEAGFIIVDKVGLTVEIDPHVRNGDGAWTGQRALLAHYRNNSMVLVDNALRLLKVGVVTS